MLKGGNDMPESLAAAYVKCPFFHKTDKLKITCEGPHDDCQCLNQIYKSNNGRDKQLKLYCQDQYEKCEIYRMLVEAKY